MLLPFFGFQISVETMGGSIILAFFGAIVTIICWYFAAIEEGDRDEYIIWGWLILGATLLSLLVTFWVPASLAIAYYAWTHFIKDLLKGIWLAIKYAWGKFPQIRRPAEKTKRKREQIFSDFD